MSARRTGIDDYRRVLDPGRMRQSLLTRAAIAAGVMLVMLVGLMIVGGDGEVDEPDAAASAPGNTAKPGLPPLSAVQGPPALPETAAAPVEIARPATAVSDGVAPSPEPEPAPAADQLVEAVEEPEVAGPTVGEPEQAPDSAPPAPPSAPVTSRNQSAAVPGGRMQDSPAGRAAVATDGFSAHLGEYGALDKAERLRQAMAAQGLPASLLRRVVIGPLSSRGTAEQLVTRLRQERKVSGFIVPDGDGRGYLVQTGVFAEANNAKSQRDRLATPGRKATIQGRVVLGPYPSRQEAESVLAKVQRERKIAGTIVAVAR